MTWQHYYIAPKSEIWQGRQDSPALASFYQVTQLLDLSNTSPEIPHTKPAFALLGFCSDEGIRRNLGREGAKEGPDQIKTCLARLPVQSQHFSCFDVGNIICKENNLEGAQEALAELTALLLKNHFTPILLGGGHEIAWGHYLGIVKQFPNESLGIVNFDAHFDMRGTTSNNTSGTPFLQMALAQKKRNSHFDYNCIGIQHSGNIKELFQTAKEQGVKIIYADDLHLGYMDKCFNFIDRVIDENQLIYTSICLDVFSIAYAPGVSAPQVMGLSPWHVVPYIRQLATSGKVVSYDIAELSPPYDVDSRTAKLAANIVFEIMHHHHPIKLG